LGGLGGCCCDVLFGGSMMPSGHTVLTEGLLGAAAALAAFLSPLRTAGGGGKGDRNVTRTHRRGGGKG
jgi:hypothetical protein